MRKILLEKTSLFVYSFLILITLSNCTKKSNDNTISAKDKTIVLSHEDSLNVQATRFFDSLPNTLRKGIVEFVKFMEYKDYLSWKEGCSVTYSTVYSIYLDTSDIYIYESYFYEKKKINPTISYIGYVQYKNLLLAFYKDSQQNFINEDLFIKEFSPNYPDENSKIAKSFLNSIWDIWFIQYRIFGKDSLVEVKKNPMW